MRTIGNRQGFSPALKFFEVCTTIRFASGFATRRVSMPALPLLVVSFSVALFHIRRGRIERNIFPGPSKAIQSCGPKCVRAYTLDFAARKPGEPFIYARLILRFPRRRSA